MTIRQRVSSSLLASLALMVPNSARAQQPDPQLEQPIITWTNYYRQRQGLAALQPNQQLNIMARRHAWHMASREEMAHELDGSTLVERARRAGYAYQAVGENVAYNEGYADPAWKFFEGWMRSPGHWQNIIGPQYSEIGVGVSRSRTGKYYACQVFGNPLSQWSQPTMVAGRARQAGRPIYTAASRQTGVPMYASPGMPAGVPTYAPVTMQGGLPMAGSAAPPGAYNLEMPGGPSNYGRHLGFSPNYEIADTEFYPYNEYGSPTPSWIQP